MGKIENSNLEKKIKKAFSAASPDILETVLADCKEQKGKIIVMSEKNRNYSIVKRLSAVAASFVLIAGIIFGISGYRANYAVASVVSLDVNPSIEIRVNRNSRVVDVLPLNSDGVIVVGEMDFKGSDIDVAVNAIIGSMLRSGYISEIANSILISVDDNDPVRSAELRERLTKEVNSLLTTDNFSGAVLSQTIAKDSEIKALADTYGITVGKAQLISGIVSQNTVHTFDELAKLSINELNLISESGGIKLESIESVGAASEKGYIGAAKALEIALNHAGKTANDIFDLETEMDYEYGVMVYEIEFNSGGYEYDYDINAVTAEIIKDNAKLDNDIRDSSAKNDNDVKNDSSASVTPNAGEITKEEATDIALKHAGFTADKVYALECERDREDGKAVFEVEFKNGNYEYDYEIDAVTGNVLKYNKDLND